jgi:hypothetical protein
MRTAVGCPLVLGLLGCTNAAPVKENPAPAATAARSAAPSALPAAPPVAPPPAASSPAPVADAPADAGAKVACTFELPAAVDRIEKVPGATVARAIVPLLDAKTMVAKVTKANVVACQGATSPATWEPETYGGKAPPNGLVRVLHRKPLPDKREGIWLATAIERGACQPPDGYGFFAIVALDEARTHVQVLGVSTWRPECGPPWALHAQKLGDETVYVEPDAEGTGAGRTSWDNVWTLRDGVLTIAGKYATEDTGNDHLGPIDDAGFLPMAFEAKAKYAGEEIVVRGEATISRPRPAEAGGDASESWIVVRKQPYAKQYALVDGQIVEKGTKAEPTKKSASGSAASKAPVKPR